jgi:hypothetical protein
MKKERFVCLESLPFFYKFYEFKLVLAFAALKEIL